MIQTSSEQIQELENELKTLPDPGQRLERGIAFMEAALDPEAPSFKNFWQSRKLCSEYFRENLVPTLRTKLWAKFCELTQEARRLKAVVEEESAFEVEQIEAAVAAVEADMTRLDQMQMDPDLARALSKSIALSESATVYASKQHKLDFLNIQATRITSLQRELAKMPIRYQMKEALFERLSKAGDQVFPSRRELSKVVREQFLHDIDQLIGTHFAGDRFLKSHTELREEIKFLQSFAKSLALSGKAFSDVRTKLCRGWDQLQEAEKERREQREQQSAQYREQAQKISDKITEIATKIASSELKADGAEKELELIVREMRATELGRQEVTRLKDQLRLARKPLDDQLEAQQKERAALAKQKEIQRSEKVHDFQKALQGYLESDSSYDYHALRASFGELSPNPKEKESMEDLLQQLEQKMLDRKEQDLLSSLSEDPQEQLDQLYEVFELRRQRCQRARDQYEQLRKAGGASGLDFTESMHYQELILESKEKLTILENTVDDLEKQISEIEE